MKNIQPKTHGSNCSVHEELGCVVIFKDFVIPISDPTTYKRGKKSSAIYEEILNDVFPEPYRTKGKLVNQSALSKIRDGIIYARDGVLSKEMVKKIVNTFTLNKIKQPIGWLTMPFEIPIFDNIPDGTIMIKGVCQGNTGRFKYTDTRYELTGGDKTPHSILSNTCMRAWFNNDNSYKALIVAPSPYSFEKLLNSTGHQMNIPFGFNPRSTQSWLEIDPNKANPNVKGDIDLVTLRFNGEADKKKRIPGKTGTESNEMNPGKADLLPAALVLDTVIKLHDFGFSSEKIRQYIATCFAINIFANVYHWAPYNASIGNKIGYLPANAELVENENTAEYFLNEDHWID